VLVVYPILIVWPEAGIQDPLLKAKIALRQVFRKRIAFGRTRMPRKMRNAGDDTGSPVLDNLPGLVREHRAGEPQEATVLVGEARASLQIGQFFWRDERIGRLGGSI